MEIRKNIGVIDRAVRIALGTVMLLAVPLALAAGRWDWVGIGLLGLVPLAAGIAGYCPPYALLGINTSREIGEHCDNQDEERRELARG